MSGKHRTPESAPRPTPTEPQITPDPEDPRYDKPQTFGKGWRR